MIKTPLVVVCGATASGKTSLSIELAKRFSGEIISADSMQIYKGMDIGTATPDADERCGIAHHLMDIIEPCESFSVADFTAAAHAAAAQISARGNNIIVVGGTGLYIDSFVKDIDFDEEDSIPELRDELARRAASRGASSLLAELAEFDPVSAERLHPNNLKRIIRAIEFYHIHKIPISEHQERTKQKSGRYRALYMMIDYPRETLYNRIERRVDAMIADGLLQEAQRLYNMRPMLSKTALQAIGYKELFEYFDHKMSLEEAVDNIKLQTRHYAKRQLTWFRRNPDMKLLNPETAVADACALVGDFLNV